MTHGGQGTTSGEEELRMVLSQCKFGSRGPRGTFRCTLVGDIVCPSPSDPYNCPHGDRELYQFIGTLRVLRNTIEAMYDHYVNQMASEVRRNSDGTKSEQSS